MQMRVDIAIVSYNTRDHLRACLESVHRSVPRDRIARVIVVDNCSGDGSAEMVRASFPWVTLVAMEENIGFGPGNNRAIAAGDAPLILFLNSDAETRPDTVEVLARFLEDNPDCVIVGPRLEYPDGRFQPSLRNFPTPWRNFWSATGLEARFGDRFPRWRNWLSEEAHGQAGTIQMVSGACFMARRLYLESIGLFDESLFMYEEEADISIPATRQGREVCSCPEAVAVHHGGASIQAGDLTAFSAFHLYRSKYIVFRKHYGAIAARLTYVTDQVLCSLSWLKNSRRARGRQSAALRRQSKKAWRSARQARLGR